MFWAWNRKCRIRKPVVDRTPFAEAMRSVLVRASAVAGHCSAGLRGEGLLPGMWGLPESNQGGQIVT